MARIPQDPFENSMDDIFSKLMNNMAGTQTSQHRYIVDGKSMTPEQYAKWRAAQQNGTAETSAKAGDGGKLLAKLGRNLTKEASENKLDPVIGRDKEIQETAEILSRRTKNNPVLVGDAGVGKTAIVEGLAQAIVAGNVPAAIRDKQIISIDISSLEAGTQYRGSFEQNIQELINEVKNAGNVIIFFDEIHQILGAGAQGGDSGSKGLADILKPALSRGEFTVIGATTQDEYRNTIMKNAALARRFNEVLVNEPSQKDTFDILLGVRDLYQKHHHVILPDDVLQAAIDYSVQYIPQRSLPDKALDLIDMTAAHLAAKNPVMDVKQLEEEMHKAQKRQQEYAEKEDYEQAAKQKQRVEQIKQQLASEQSAKEVTATPADVASAVERLTGIPVSQLDANDIERLRTLGKRLAGKVIGQDDAVKQVARAIRRNRAGFDEGNRPIGSFLFVGPTGVGKTELAKRLAAEMFGSKDALIRLDMSEYADKTAVSKLIGTTAGYVGYDDNSNTLTERVRRQPYSIILLDEIEKADPQVITLLLQVLDDGRLTDGQGNTVNFKNTVIIATSNAGFGNESVEKAEREHDQAKLIKKLQAWFRPEFLNRFNAIVEFSHLTPHDLEQIVDLMLDEVNQTLKKKNITLKVSAKAKEHLVDEGYDEAMGARPLRRVIEQQIRDGVTDYYLDHPEERHLAAWMKDGKIVVTAEKDEAEVAKKEESNDKTAAPTA